MKNVYNVIPKDAQLTQLSGSKTLFKKQLIRFGDWIDPIFPEDVMRIDRVFLETLVKNYKNGVPGRIPVPLTHTDNPEYNTGELVDLTIEGDGAQLEDGLYGTLDIRRTETAEQIRNETIFDVSISFTDNYQDNENGALYGPTLLHVALVNNPYIKKMGGFTQLAEDLKKLFGAKFQYRMLSENAVIKETSMSQLKNDREFPVELTYKNGEEDVTVTLAPGEEVEVSEDQVEDLQKVVAEAEAPVEDQKTEAELEAEAKAKADLENAEKGDIVEDDATKLSESEKTKRELAEAKAELRRRDVNTEYEKQLADGKIIPAQKDAYMALCDAVHGQSRQLSDGNTQPLTELLAEFVSKGVKQVALSEENGEQDPVKGPLENLSEESKLGLKQMNVSEADYVKYGARENISINELGAE